MVCKSKPGSKKTVHRVVNKVLGTVVSKEGHADNLVGHKKTRHY